MPARDRPDGLAVAIIGAGPTASSFLERFAASAPELLAGRHVTVHLIDPFRAGVGRVWRPDQSPLVWMNSMAEDVTMFTDASVTCDGPVRPGPSLIEWAQQLNGELSTPELTAEVRALTGMTFPTRLVQTEYLDWFRNRILGDLPREVSVISHPTRAVDLTEDRDGRQLVHLEGAPPVHADTVILTLGHLDAVPADDESTMGRFAEQHGLVHLAPAHTAELDLSVLEPGASVAVRGFGQAFTDLLALLTEGRGGRFEEDRDGRLAYIASGAEPVLFVGSRRGVPYRCKPAFRLQADLARLPRFLTPDAVEQLVAQGEPIDFARDVWPLLAKDVAWTYYHELFVAHPERTDGSWEDIAHNLEAFVWADATLHERIAHLVPDVDDRLDFDRIDRPLRGLHFDSIDQFEEHLRAHVGNDIRRRTDPAYSAEQAGFMGLLITFGILGRIAGSGRMSVRSRVVDVAERWFSFFMYYASGPPPARLQQLLALSDAGIVRFLGADTWVRADPVRGCFLVGSCSHPDVVEAVALVEARVAKPSLSRTRDELLQRLVQRGEVLEEVVREGEWELNTGKLVVGGPDLRVVNARGQLHEWRHALGTFTNRPAAGAFARPRTNAPMFRQNDVVARSVLTALRRVPLAEHDQPLDARTGQASGG
jgi:hypothetical protein